jgi:biopolymer transport protein ExbD
MGASTGGGGKKGLIVLNLTSMIDISAIIIIFLVMGTVFGTSAIEPPTDMKFPKSFNKEMIENAPQIIIKDTTIEVPFLHRQIEIGNILEGNEEKLKVIQVELKKYIESIPIEVKGSGVLLNVLADKKTPYKVIYEVSSFFRLIGFQSMLFVAEGN